VITRSARIELGDFQTPSSLARRIVQLLISRGVAPRTVVEPTCGRGSFVEASLTGFRAPVSVVAYDVNPDYVRETAALDRRSSTDGRLACHVANFFVHEWTATLASLPEPILVIGNPPWVTASGLGALGGANLPKKSNFQRRRGLDAVTGKSNFDVAEWMLLKLFEAAEGRDVTIAMLVKTSVARRVLSHLWRTGANVQTARMFGFDAAMHFGVAAEACLFFCRVGRPPSIECSVADLDRPDVELGCVAWRDEALVSDPIAYDRHKSLLVSGSSAARSRWRSGVKHDCAAVMELRRTTTGAFVNGTGRRIELEPEYVHPLLKGTDLAHDRVGAVRKWLLITQGKPGDDTSIIATRAPSTWAYLCAHGAELDARRSSIYRGRPRFSVFGVGPYTFAPWKVAISALHKRLVFTTVGPVENRPVVFDDTCYHLACDSEAEARLLTTLLNAECSQELLGALVFWDAKRPITTEILQRLDLERVAARLGLDGGADERPPATGRRRGEVAK
jgi:hypothetical protein